MEYIYVNYKFVQEFISNKIRDIIYGKYFIKINIYAVFLYEKNKKI